MVDFKIKVLILDDKEFMLDEIYGYIEKNPVKSIGRLKYDFEIFATTDPCKALDIYKNLRIDIVVVDFELDNLDYDGISSTKEILKLNENAIVIGMSSESSPNVESFKKCGIKVFLEKPFQDSYITSKVDAFTKDIILSETCDYISSEQRKVLIADLSFVKPKEKIKITNRFKNMKKNRSIENMEKIIKEEMGMSNSKDVDKHIAESHEFTDKIDLELDISSSSDNVDTAILGEDINSYSLLESLGIDTGEKNKKNDEILFTFDDDDTYNELYRTGKTSKNIDIDLGNTKKSALEESKVNFDIGNNLDKDYNYLTKDSKNLLDTSSNCKKGRKKDEYQDDNKHINDHKDFYDLEVDDLPDRSKLLEEIYRDGDIEGNNKGVNKNKAGNSIVSKILKRRV